jgi:hypothetical protein
VALILWAGVLPAELHPVNRVEWLDPGPGLAFGRGGIAYSEEEIRWPPGSRDVSVELWVVPGDEPDGRLGQIFSLYDDEAIEPLLIAQWKSGLVVRNRIRDSRGRVRSRELGSLGMLFRDRKRGIAVTSDASGTEVFLDGVASGHRTSIPLIEDGEDFGGRVVIGNSATGAAPWTGDLLGVAVFDRRLAADEVAAHHAVVDAGGVARLAGEPGLQALYTFAERSGLAAGSGGTSGPALEVPLDFRQLRRPLLELPDLRGRRADVYGRDALLNLLGFVPLGFFAAAALRRRGLRTASGIQGAVALGLLLSLSIELIQSALPARVSSATDLVTNLLGTALGASAALLLPWADRFAPRPPAPSGGTSDAPHRSRP